MTPPPPPSGYQDGELVIYNQTSWYTNEPDEPASYPIKVKIYPKGAFFNGAKKYSPNAVNLINNTPAKITGFEFILVPNTNSLNWRIEGNFDRTSAGDNDFAYGYGLYKIEFYKPNGNNPLIWDFVDSCYMDWQDELIDYIGYGNTFDFKIYYFSKNVIAFRHEPHNSNYPWYYYNISEVNRHIKMWELHGTFLQGFEHRIGTFFPDNTNSQYLTWPILATDYQTPIIGHDTPGDVSLNLSIDNSLIQNIFFKPNQTLTFKNGASLIAKNVTFNTTSSGSSWNGIKLENSGTDTIVNCTFNNAKTSISILDDYLGNNPNKIIRKNTFNVSQTNGRGIDIRNQNKILIDSNTFNFSNSNSTIGIFFRNADPPSGASQNIFYSFNLNIINNKFNYGYLPIYISNLTSSRPPFYIYKNSFIGNNIYSIGGSKISGDIKNNKFDVNNINRAIGLWNSNPNIYGNDIGSISANMYLNVSFPKINPSVNANNQLVWTGGRNVFNSLFNENVYLDGSYPYIDNGRNLFSIDATNHHIFGRMPDTVNSYRMTYNCWNGHNDLPSYFLYKLPNDTLHQIYDVIYTPTYCDATINSVSNIITDRGDGIYDTVLVSNTISSDPISDDEILLNQARASNDSKDYADAVTNYKGLIDDFAESEYVYTSLYEMYDNYSALDTSDDQTVTDVLFSDLKQYLQNKISSDNYDKDFNSLAFEIILMCETQMKNYEAALTGYEFIALYHPNADQRMLASWDYEEIEGLINGEGGGEKQLQITNYELQIEEYELNELKRIDKLINEDPLLKTLKKNYEKISLKNVYSKSDKTIDDKIILRAKENIFVTKFLQKEDKENRFIDDLKLLMSKGNTNSNSEESKISEPQEYKLNQNYPNPFNPITNITFEIPFGSHVTLKVYDVAGKEITTLVNEFKQKGSYNVTFNGLNLSSGIYYFKISAGEWNQVRKMMLIK